MMLDYLEKYYLVKVNMRYDGVIFEFCNGTNHRSYSYKSEQWYSEPIKPNQAFYLFELQKLFKILDKKDDTNDDESYCSKNCLFTNLDIIKQKIMQNSRFGSGYDPHERYHIEKVLHHANFVYYKDCHLHLVLAELQCEKCKKFFIGIFYVSLEELVGQIKNDGVYGWTSHEFPISAEGYLQALSTYLELLKITTINQWIQNGVEHLSFKKRKSRAPDIMNRFGVVTEKLPPVNTWIHPLFAEVGSRSSSEAPHETFDTFTFDDLTTISKGK